MKHFESEAVAQLITRGNLISQQSLQRRVEEPQEPVPRSLINDALMRGIQASAQRPVAQAKLLLQRSASAESHQSIQRQTEEEANCTGASCGCPSSTSKGLKLQRQLDAHPSEGMSNFLSRQLIDHLLMIQRQPSQSEPTLRLGSNLAAVAHLQQDLVQAGAGIGVDGIFGPMTQKAVMAFQKAAGLTADGIVGPMTWNSLHAGSVTISAEADTANSKPSKGKAGNKPSSLDAMVAAKLQAIKAALKALNTQEDESAESAASSHAAKTTVQHQGCP